MRAPRTVIVRGVEPGVSAQVLDVLRLPKQTLEFTPAQILIVPQLAGDSDARRRVLLQSVYKLTAAETGVSLLLAKGHTAEVIAAMRSVSIATVRAQIKSILSKLHITRQVELVAKLAQL
jgi:DNA-binding CsgD family transcriptional regulator